MDSNIRPATTSDIEDLIRVWSEGATTAFGEKPLDLEFESTYIHSTFERQVLTQNHTHKIWVFSRNEKVIAYCSILPFQPSPLWYHKWAFASLYVDKFNQNKTIGFRLLKYALDEASKSEIKYVVSTVVNTNVRAKKLALKLGYKALGELPHSVSDNDLPKTELFIFEA